MPATKQPEAPFTWTQAVPRLVQVASRAPQPEARKLAMEQLMLLAEIVDRHIAQLQALHDALPDKEQRCADCGVRGSHALGCPVASTQLEPTDHVCAECGSVNTTCDKCAAEELESGVQLTAAINEVLAEDEANERNVQD